MGLIVVNLLLIMASGVEVDADCISLFSKVKKKSAPFRYMILYIEGEKKIKVEGTGEKEKGFEDFISELTVHGDGECRYGIFDYHYTSKCEGAGEAQKDKLVLVSWCPDTAKVKKKMLYSSSFEALKKALGDSITCVQANDESDLDKKNVEDKIKTYDRN